jgi:para-aminobenzoate synthetase component 1
MTLTKPGVVTPKFVKLDPSSSVPEMFGAFQEMPYPALLDSAFDSPGLARFSYLTADPFLILRSKGRRVEVEAQGATRHLDSNPFDVLQGLLRRYTLERVQDLPPFQGGVIGYLSYELAHHLEDLPRSAVDDLQLPEMNIGFYDWVLARDHSTGATWAVTTGFPDGDEGQARDRLRWIEGCLSQTHSSSRPPEPFYGPRSGFRTRSQEESRGGPPPLVGAWGEAPDSFSSPSPSRKERETQGVRVFQTSTSGLRSTFSRDSYVEAVRSVKDYIRQGDVYQANISQRFEYAIQCDPWELYLRLRQVNPAPFAVYLQYPEVAVLSASPEQFLHMESGAVQARPMKGTRPRGKTGSEDRRLAAELLASEKDRAENIMIVDLLRSDLGKVCKPGTVEVADLFGIEEYPTVFQMVSTVRGALRPDVDAVDVIKACFPGGSVTGAPKIRAMEIIDELEPSQRSVYCGALGYIGFDGCMQTSIPIRILLVKGRKAYFQVGGGIVADSEPQAEYEETLIKARGSLETLGIRH